jgi:SAM-dependent methyltransferase
MEWLDYLHLIRRREIDRIFGECPPRVFPLGLELGAGDGYQSSLLGAYVERLLATDWDVSLLSKSRAQARDVYPVDAEAVAETFAPATFDLVFSSNVLEHVPKPGTALRGVHTVLKDDGLTIHVMPSPLWKLADISLFWPDLVVRRLHRLTNRDDETGRCQDASSRLVNNPKISAEAVAHRRRFLPPPHGAYQGHIEEFQAFRKIRWLQEFEWAGFHVIRVIKGPLCSGYGLGWDGPRWMLERLGLTSEYAYVAVKHGRRSPYEDYFRDDGRGAVR